MVLLLLLLRPRRRDSSLREKSTCFPTGEDWGRIVMGSSSKSLMNAELVATVSTTDNSTL